MNKDNTKRPFIYNIFSIIFGVFIFLLALDLMSNSFKLLGKDAAESIIFATSNPFISLFIGLLMTALIQSSSTSTSMIVAAVASGSISLPDAVPMIMGANIGTTLTSTIVSLGYITNKNVFRKAIASATVHDFFNILTILILFPLEYYYGFVSVVSQTIVELTISPEEGLAATNSGFRLFEFIPLAETIVKIFDNSVIVLGVSFVLLFASIKILSSLISKLLIGESKSILTEYIFVSPFKSFAWGTAITGAIQSSSVITSLIVPLVATGKVQLEKAFPFIMGANIGTTITAFIAAFFNTQAAMGIAVTHLLINLIGVLFFLPFPTLRRIPVLIASFFGRLTMNNRLVGFAYVMFTFFIIPFVLIYFNKGGTKLQELTYRSIQMEQEHHTLKKVISRDLANNKNKDWLDNAKLATDNLPPEKANIPVYNIHQKGNVLFINSNFYLINKIGFCWDGENSEGKFKMCIENILKTYTLSDSLKTDSVYIYSKNFYLPEQLDSISYKYYICIKDKLLVNTEKLDKNGNILFQEKLINIEDI